MHQFIPQLINGISAGAVYALIAVGYTMVYGVLRLINFAHGDLYMVGAMMGLYAATRGFDLFLFSHAHPIAMSVFILLGLGTSTALICLKLADYPRMNWLRAIAEGIAALAACAIVMDLAGRIIHHVGAPSWTAFGIALAAPMAVCAMLGFIIERIAYRPLRDQPRITALITAIGVSMFLEFGGQRVFGPTPQAFPKLIPGLEEHPYLWQHGEITIGKVDVLILVVTLLLMFALNWIVMRTRTGLALRAVSHRFETSALMGVNIDRIVSFTFMLGSALAAAAGVLAALRAPRVEPMMGLVPGIKAFVAAVLGGIGNIPGAVAGGFLLGLTDVMVSAYFPNGSQARDAIAFVILIAVLLVKPSGLFGSNAIEKV